MKKKIAAAVIAVLLLVILGSSVVVTAENEFTLIRQFGRISKVVDQPGVSLKLPFVQTVDAFPKQTLLYDLVPSEVITRDKKTMITDSYVLWRISEPMKFAQTLNGSVMNAESRINTAVYNALKNAISSMNQDEVITSRDGELSALVMDKIDDNMDQYGIELMLFETKQLDLPDDNKEAVYAFPRRKNRRKSLWQKEKQSICGSFRKRMTQRKRRNSIRLCAVLMLCAFP